MKTDIHPTYFEEAKVTCACGNVFTVGATLASFHVDLCNKCHPFYTGEQRFVDTEGRVEKFRRLQAQKVTPKKKKDEIKAPEQPRTLKEMLESLG
ncbi:MAG: 50S ribosomal protein L31 [Candidatus Woykebacteria bacterium RIFCSPHIGHO2_12_FULL_43_10]|uniref:Large ribosomal subunit protein bL31 n=2 Tax=Candidatus Woykeibacteriota TaxID=1817899 RepID=A0A1G1WY21_9BACT|nr:MAG: 50S ribosomal protein L31 [Candidatus Woykebacteria bacterium RIFCSPHIGHO2_01_FULL_43_29]OGY29659.1 MAG: 50S ribosomal protein L31 [Candidatus Woykebacteria bacterium RIFCSPHIGHO2_12_FULL_43_10]OGY29985.1 MAG: 50S ribosomal protein L31 [Candidatus Woykebacteria bacterium RIFCSPHIGHO2_02_FULL_43_16b]OGY32027.1 MAG: 50S ribosomal protein L31 [Candidatus Woykebacteria bacterium RIFCSPLOWO2_01_FULL_43_14]